MCLKPIHIINRSRRFKTGIDRPILDVPCGKCEKCQSRKQDDWFVRACAEWQRVKKNKGFVWFATLTYRNEDLPVWKDKDYNFIAPTFDKSHFVSFRNKLRVYLSRAGYDFTGDMTIRYLYVTEYGEEKGRSHLHALLFVPAPIDYNEFADLVEKSWIYGYVMYSKLGRTIQSVKGLKYVMKYMHKDMLWYDRYKVDEYLKNLKFDSKHDIKAKLKLCDFRKRLPHHCQSMGFGSDFIVSDDEFIDGYISSSRLGLYDAKFEFSVPLYYKRKFLYDFDNVNNIYNINTRGLHIKQVTFDKLIHSLEKYYSSVLYSDKVEKLSELVCPDLANDRKEYFDAFIKLRNEDCKDVALFALVFRGVALKKENIDDFNNMSAQDFLKMQCDKGYFYFMSQIDKVGCDMVNDWHLNGALRASKFYGYNDVNIYRTYHKGLMYLEEFEKRFGQQLNNALEQKFYNQSIQFAKLFAYG